MSGPEPPSEPSVPTTGLKRKQMSDQGQEDLDQLDNAFKRIRKSAPRAPYILSTPSLSPYHYRSFQASRAWMMGHLFKPEEETLQYQTFLFREPYQDLFTLQPGEDDEPEATQPKSQISDLANQRPKKKISLADYKNKQANGAGALGSKKVPAAQPPAKPNVPQTNGVGPSHTQAPAHQQEKGNSAQSKRPEKKALEKPDARDRANQPAASSQKSESAESNMNIDKSASNSTPHGLPPMLSPVQQPPSNPYGLPTILSPTLPPNVQIELEKIETRSRADSNTSASSSDRKKTPLETPETSAAMKRPPSVPVAKNGEAAPNMARARSISINGKSPLHDIVGYGDNHARSLVVKLRFSKKSRENLKRLLALPQKRDAQIARKERDEHSHKAASQIKAPMKPVPKLTGRRPEAAATASKAPVPTIKVTEKRPRPEDDSAQSSPVPAKRPRSSTVTSQQDRPITPRDQTTLSPATSNKPSAQKGQTAHTTPRKDLKAVNMLRTNSTESQLSTPGKSGVTPTGARLDPQAHTSAPPLGSLEQQLIADLQKLAMHLNTLGRSLKHEGQRLERENAGKLTNTEDKRYAAVLAIECVLVWMCSFHTQDQRNIRLGRPRELESTWKTLPALCSSFSRFTKDFPHLDGVRCQLGAVIAANICTLVSQRVANLKIHASPHELSVAELTKQHSQLNENLSVLTVHYQMLQRNSTDARIAFPLDELRRGYPRTYMRAEWGLKPEKIVLDMSQPLKRGPYWLPIQNDTTPIQAVRFGIDFLLEFCEKEKMNYTMKIEMDED